MKKSNIFNLKFDKYNYIKNTGWLTNKPSDLIRLDMIF